MQWFAVSSVFKVKFVNVKKIAGVIPAIKFFTNVLCHDSGGNGNHNDATNVCAVQLHADMQVQRQEVVQKRAELVSVR